MLQRQQRVMERAVPREVNRGLNSVKRIVQEKNIEYAWAHGVLHQRGTAARRELCMQTHLHHVTMHMLHHISTQDQPPRPLPRGVHGALMEVFQVDAKLMRAVEVTAGASLFHIVCDNEETALRITEELRKQQAGRATFMPLNRCVLPLNRHQC